MRRREVLLGSGAAVLGTGGLGTGMARAAVPGMSPALPAGTREAAELAAPEGKHDLIKLSWRPPNFESPLDAFATPITPNARFFVRYHLAMLPTMETLRDWSLSIGGDAAEKPATIGLAALKALPAVEITAVCQCSGNRRGLFQPHVPGVEWGVGAMGNARWKGARLRDVLALAGVKASALEIWLRGADGPVLDATPAFAKSLPVERAMDDNTIIAYEMNGEALPLLNGFPARVIVPGWTATYWMKHIAHIEVSSKPLDNFWMQKAYRVPKGMFPVARPFASQEAEANSPITEIVVNSLVTNLGDGARVAAGGFEVKGIAWDGGSGIRVVETSMDGGQSWQAAALSADLGRFAFRPFTARLSGKPGELAVLVRATSNAGQIQADKLKFNPAGYHHNVIQKITLVAA